jgi:hypothetical protein
MQDSSSSGSAEEVVDVDDANDPVDVDVVDDKDAAAVELDSFRARSRSEYSYAKSERANN